MPGERDMPPAWAEHPTLGSTGCGGRPPLICHIPGVAPRLAQLPSWDVAKGLHQRGGPAGMECAVEIGR